MKTIEKILLGLILLLLIAPAIQKDRDMSKGDSANTSHIAMSSHAGTHIDFPYHFSLDGKKIKPF